ncbi:response regulator [Aquipuribacter sp. MA13-6]|uniref:response regulator n=1 Tax=unclassified Aquipuribacter TaxID=2635084 RepID=UPI003EEB5283
MPRRVVVVEDHALLAQSVALVLRHSGREVTVLGPLDDVEATARDLPPATVLLDLDLGRDRLGDDLVAPLHAAGHAVVVVTGATDEARLGACLLAGAVAVLDKSVPLDVLVGTVELVESGRPVLDRARREHLVRAARRQREQRSAAMEPFDRLTPGEAEVLEGIVLGRRAADIARQRVVSLATVRAQVRAVLSKLGVASQLEAAALAHRSGWWERRSGGR